MSTSIKSAKEKSEIKLAKNRNRESKKKKSDLQQSTKLKEIPYTLKDRRNRMQVYIQLLNSRVQIKQEKAVMESSVGFLK